MQDLYAENNSQNTTNSVDRKHSALDNLSLSISQLLPNLIRSLLSLHTHTHLFIVPQPEASRSHLLLSPLPTPTPRS